MRGALLVCLSWLSLALFGTLLVPPSALQGDLHMILQPPGSAAWLGTDSLGRSVLASLVAGARTSLVVACAVVGLAAVLGTFIGVLAGFFGGWLDRSIVRVIDLFLAFPGILLAIALAAVLQPGIGNVVIALAVVGWVGYARLARAQTLALVSRDHVTAARALGCGPWRIMRVHVVPLILAPLIVEATFGISGTVIAEAGLSFLGLGVQPPATSWGSMIRDGVAYLLVAPYLVLAPGLAVLLVVLAVNLLGDALRDRYDVRLRSLS